jgi:hypothetical protein
MHVAQEEVYRNTIHIERESETIEGSFLKNLMNERR